MAGRPHWRDADRGGREERALNFGQRCGRFGRPQIEKMIRVETTKRPKTSSHANNTRDIQFSPPGVRGFLYAFIRPSCRGCANVPCNFRAELVNHLFSTGYLGSRIPMNDNCKEIRQLRVGRVGNAVRLARRVCISLRGAGRVLRMAGWQIPRTVGKSPPSEDADLDRRRSSEQENGSPETAASLQNSTLIKSESKPIASALRSRDLRGPSRTRQGVRARKRWCSSPRYSGLRTA